MLRPGRCSHPLAPPSAANYLTRGWGGGCHRAVDGLCRFHLECSGSRHGSRHKFSLHMLHGLSSNKMVPITCPNQPSHRAVDGLCRLHLGALALGRPRSSMTPSSNMTGEQDVFEGAARCNDAEGPRALGRGHFGSSALWSRAPGRGRRGQLHQFDQLHQLHQLHQLDQHGDPRLTGAQRERGRKAGLYRAGLYRD